jgi:hypothetical protein
MGEVTLDEQNEKLYAYENGFHALHLIYTGAKLGLFEKTSTSDATPCPEIPPSHIFFTGRTRFCI